MLTAVKGTQDLYFPDIRRWQRLERAARAVFERYGFAEIRTPVLEHTELFVRGIGDETDIVSKEMYTFNDKKGRSLTLRPENTAGVVRAIVEHRLFESPTHARLYYIGPQFRYERPQKGRHRQFHQIGMEVIGEEAPGCDAEGITLAADLLRDVGIDRVLVGLNSVGCPNCRPGYVARLKEALAGESGALCSDCRRRLETNPLRVLDCKVPSCQPILDKAPRFPDHLCDECAGHFAGLKSALHTLGVPFEEKHRMVRGLDYYTRTVFEITSGSLGAQDALMGGGRYDGLLAEIGGPDAPGFGWALGMERLLMAMPEDEGGKLPWIYVAWAGKGAYEAALNAARKLREADLPVVLEHSERSFKSSFKRADRIGTRWTLVLGENEVAEGRYALKDMESGRQESFPLPELIRRLKEAGA
jgi:histidyl-tRNA synthetase